LKTDNPNQKQETASIEMSISINNTAQPFMISSISGNPDRYCSSANTMPIFTRTNPDGSITFAMPSNAPADSIAFNRNRVFQMERKTKMVARLRAKLDKK